MNLSKRRQPRPSRPSLPCRRRSRMRARTLPSRNGRARMGITSRMGTCRSFLWGSRALHLLRQIHRLRSLHNRQTGKSGGISSLENENGTMIFRRFKNFLEGLIEPTWIGDARERHLSRILNGILLLLLVWGIAFEIQYRLSSRPLNIVDTFGLIMVGILALAFHLNRQGQFIAARILTLGLFITAILTLALIQHWAGAGNLFVLYSLIVAILMSELFFSMRGYLVAATIILLGVFGISLLNPAAESIFVFLSIFCALIGFSSYNRRFIEKEQVTLARKFAHEQFLLFMEQRKSTQLGLREEVGRQVMNSLDEREILERTLGAVVNKF